MCKLCHQGLSDEQVIEQLSTINSFEGVNETSISHVILAYLGANGPIAENIATGVLNDYIQYKKENKKDSDGSFFGEPTIEYVTNEINNANKMKRKMIMNNIITYDEKKHYIFTGEMPKKTNNKKILMTVLVCSIIVSLFSVLVYYN